MACMLMSHQANRPYGMMALVAVKALVDVVQGC